MLPETITTYLQQAAQQAHTKMPEREASLFLSGLLDSFSLLDFVTLIENECGIKVEDRELRPENFDTLAKVEALIARAQAVK
ncbi:MAG: acyl carrier protein [Acidobacteria bacterium]|nr:acyl carrier protein [Acidobacteriota bacterium]